MITTWIQAVYQFLWGDLLRIPLGRLLFWCITAYYFADPHRNLFHDQNKIFAGSSFWRYGSRIPGKEGGWQFVNLSDIDRLNCNKSRNGESGLSSCCRFRRWCRCGFLMWITAIIGSSTAFIEATLAQLYKEKDPLYGGYREVRHTICIMQRDGQERQRNMSVLRCSLQSQGSSAGPGSVRWSVIRLHLLLKMHLGFRQFLRRWFW